MSFVFVSLKPIHFSSSVKILSAFWAYPKKMFPILRMQQFQGWIGNQNWLVVWNIFFSHILGIIIPIDFHIFQRAAPTTNQRRHGQVFRLILVDLAGFSPFQLVAVRLPRSALLGGRGGTWHSSKLCHLWDMVRLEKGVTPKLMILQALRHLRHGPFGYQYPRWSQMQWYHSILSIGEALGYVM